MASFLFVVIHSDHKNTVSENFNILPLMVREIQPAYRQTDRQRRLGNSSVGHPSSTEILERM